MEQLKKQKAKKTKKDKKEDKEETEKEPADAGEAVVEEPADDTKDGGEGDVPGEPEKEKKEEQEEEEEAAEDAEGDGAQQEGGDKVPSLSQQSKLRSASFRKASLSGSLSPGTAGTLASPDGETAPDIYRKHVVRIEELERENKRLAREAADAEKRWQKAEEELADLREGDGESRKPSGQVEKLVRCVTLPSCWDTLLYDMDGC